MSETFLCWRCRECGKRSYAKRDPIAHHRWADTVEDGQKIGRSAVWCGPFDRYVARLDVSKPQRPPLPHLGEPVGRSYEFNEDDGGLGVPF